MVRVTASRELRPALLIPLLAAFTLCSVRAAHAAPVVIDTTYRSLRPGELVVVTIKVEGDAANVRVKAFGRDVHAYQADDGWWRALVGIDLDQRPGRYVIEAEASVNGAVLRQTRALTIVARKFPTRNLRVNPSFVNPSPAELERIRDDQKFLRVVYAAPSPARLWSAAFVRPVPGEANSSFGTRSVFNGEPRSPHGGTDFLSPSGTPIKAPNAGRVVSARDL